MAQLPGRDALFQRIQSLTSEQFGETALDVYRYQAAHNPVYRRYLELIGRLEQEPAQWWDIPCLPIELFKSHTLQTGRWTPERVFTSSGTTGQVPSRHAVRSVADYLANARRGFRAVYGPVEDYCVLALLPSYLERTGSSLVAMAQDFIERSQHPESGFFLDNQRALLERLTQCRQQGIPVLLIGVSFALLDLAEAHPTALGERVIIMETGGMKGRRKELTREALHAQLGAAFGQERIHSEYGMTELLSQGYSTGDGLFVPAPTLRIRVRELTDPLQVLPSGRAGGVNLFDLANLDTISFIAAQDIGRVYADETFRILGRIDASDVRGCNLMVQ